mmetsp:Transcript_31196/g.85545  ORF Transcript_31196/g.85545 Transcript_31196/m.85545 type:complete len:202 (+) Transcript_31196:1069-1674(+)
MRCADVASGIGSMAVPIAQASARFFLAAARPTATRTQGGATEADPTQKLSGVLCLRARGSLHGQCPEDLHPSEGVSDDVHRVWKPGLDCLGCAWDFVMVAPRLLPRPAAIASMRDGDPTCWLLDAAAHCRATLQVHLCDVDGDAGAELCHAGRRTRRVRGHGHALDNDVQARAVLRLAMFRPLLQASGERLPIAPAASTIG